MSILYPEFVFAQISSFLGNGPEGDFLRKFTGNCTVRDDILGSTYRNGVLHSYDDKPAEIRYDRFIVWYKDGKIHREGDKPAHIDIKYPEDCLKWFLYGKLHREGGLPAVINSKERIWYKHGVIHRDNNELPAYINGKTQKWYVNGELHRDGDRPAVIQYEFPNYLERPHLYVSWFKRGKLHREGDKPAHITGAEEHVRMFLDPLGQIYLDKNDLPYKLFTGYVRQEWYINGLRHRENDKPAIRSGPYYAEWYKNGQKHRDGKKPYCVSGNTAWRIVDGKVSGSFN
jgi:hypothetical protein